MNFHEMQILPFMNLWVHEFQAIKVQELKLHKSSGTSGNKNPWKVHELFMHFHEMQILPFMNLPVHEVPANKVHERYCREVHELSFSWIHSSWTFAEAAYVHECESWIIKSSLSIIWKISVHELGSLVCEKFKNLLSSAKVHELGVHETESSLTTLISSRKIHSPFKNS